MNTAIFYLSMALFGAIYGVVVTEPREDKRHLSLSNRYPVLGVLLFFVALGVTYYLLRLADKDVLRVYFGTITIVVSFFSAGAVYKQIYKKKS